MPILYPASNRFKYARSASDFRARRYAIQNPPPFSPSLLFAAMEQGAWYDPSDLTTLYQDATGTTPVTAVEQPVGLMLDKSKGLVLGPELVVNGDFSAGTTGWTVAANSTFTASEGVATFTRGAFEEAASTGFSCVIGRSYRVTATLVSTSGLARLGFTVAPNSLSGSNSNLLQSAIPQTISVVLTATSSTMYFGVSGALNGTIATIDNISVRELPGAHASQTTATSRPVLSARYNLLTKTESFDDAVWLKAGSTLTSNAGANPIGGSNATRLVGTGIWYAQQNHARILGVQYTVSIYVKSNTGANQTFRLYGQNMTIGSDLVATSVWQRFSFTFTSAGTDSTTGSGITRGAAGTSADLLIWGADLRPTNQADLPYQRVNTATDYQTIGFPSGEVFDGVDDSQIASSGGGSTARFFWCGAIQCKKIGQAQTLFSDTGTNTGYRVRINSSNQLELSAGNGTAFTTVATAGTMAIGQRAVLTAWHDGASLKVQIDNGTVATAAFVTATAGTAQFTMGKDNNAASSFFGGWLYEKVYLKDDVPSDAEIASTKQYMAEAAGVTL